MNLPARRTRENAVLTGVCAGLARRWGVDANLLRIALIILAFASGLGLVLYGVGYLVLPTDDATPAPVHRLLPFTKDWPLPALAVALTAVGFVGFGMLGGWSGVGILPVLVALGIWYAASRRSGRPAIAPEPTPFERAAEAWRLRLLEHQATSGTLAIPAPAATAFAPSVPPSPAPTEVVRRTRPRNNRLWWLALGLATLGCTGVALFTPFGSGTHIAGLNYLAAILISLGITLLVGTWLGRPRLMGLLTVLVMIATGITWVAQTSPPGTASATFADQTYAFTSNDDLPETIQLTAGSLELDFTGLELTEDATVDVEVSAGDILVRLPQNANSVVSWDVGLGDVSLTDLEHHDRADTTVTTIDDSEYTGAGLTGGVARTFADDAPVLTINVHLRAGALEVQG